MSKTTLSVDEMISYIATSRKKAKDEIIREGVEHIYHRTKACDEFAEQRRKEREQMLKKRDNCPHKAAVGCSY